jgi:hypothetical protein
MIPMKQNSDHIDPCTLNFFIDGELHVCEEERIRQHVKRCRLCALYVVSGNELKEAIRRAGRKFAPFANGAFNVSQARKGNLVCIGRQSALREAVRQLSPGLREALLLCDMQELSYREIALLLDIPISVVIARISDARDTLCRLLILQLGKLQ